MKKAFKEGFLMNSTFDQYIQKKENEAIDYTISKVKKIFGLDIQEDEALFYIPLVYYGLEKQGNNSK